MVDIPDVKYQLTKDREYTANVAVMRSTENVSGLNSALEG
jgi:hypothetical protein